jgi:hypothetical protein
MERKIGVERLYKMGEFANLKFISEITNIPQEIALNKEAVRLINYSQTLEAERAYQDYTRLKLEKLPKGKLEDVIVSTIEIIEEEQSRTWEQLLELIKDKTEDEQN